MGFKILVINPGAGSTKVALFDDEEQLFREEIRHLPEELKKYESTIEQLPMRKALVLDLLKKWGVELEELDAVVGRGGAFKPLEGGVYEVNQNLLDDIRKGNVQADHPSNLGALIAYEIAQKAGGIPAYFVDPVSVDEFDEVARPSGLPELPRRSLLHTLNSRYVARKAAEELGVRYEDMNMVVAHLGTGISISAHRKGRIIDVNNANDGGPFSPQRTGSLPTTGLIKLAFSGKYDVKGLLRKVTKEGGLLAYLGTDDIPEIERRIDKGDKEAELIYNAMIYQIGKEIGAYAAALKGMVDLIVVTGGMARSERLCAELLPYIEWIARVKFYPGEFEMEALAYGALRALRGEEHPKTYK
ncbi:MAG: butyrate kinase [Candidatus Hydrothermota bacterium]|nr:MAG: butyrate kinase [Candidatus Hydrothermae bacterium]